MKVLILDDDPHIVNCFSELLSDSHEVFSTSSPFEAVNILKGTVIDLIITDYNMPELCGLELANIAIDNYNTDVIIITGDIDFNTVNEKITVLRKPIMFSTLIKHVLNIEEKRLK